VVKPNRRIDAVIFDLDDTLIDWSQSQGTWDDISRPRTGRIYDYLAATGHIMPDRDLFHRRIQELFQQSWVRAKEAWRLASFGETLQECFRSFDLDQATIDLDEVMRLYEWGVWPGVVPFADTVEVLTELRQRGYKTGLVTNSFVPMWMRDVELEKLGLLPYLDFRLASGDIGYIKPHPAIYERILDMIATTPERALFVGDRPENDIAGAKEAGMISVLIKPPHLDRPLGDVRPDYTIVSLTELLPILEALEGEYEQARAE
jgi:putative hydrolase of the HAD superfamily